MSGALQAVFQNQRSFGAPPGSQSYTSAGTYSWVAPAGVTSVSIVAIGGGASGGGGLGYRNNYSVTPGNSYTVQVGAGVSAISTANTSYFSASCVVSGIGASGATGGGHSGTGGGNGGNAWNTRCRSGAGAGGYSGNGGNGFGYTCGSPTAGSGGGGGGAASQSGGGGVGLFGQGSNGVRGFCNPIPYVGGGGSGGSSGQGPVCQGNCCGPCITGGAGGFYGGGAGGALNAYGIGGSGAVRIVWPGNTRTFPSTCVGSP